jgi:hypothetical protein
MAVLIKIGCFLNEKEDINLLWPLNQLFSVSIGYGVII